MARNALGYEFGSADNCLKGRVVYGTVYGEMHLKDLLGSFVRVGYRIPFPDFYLVLHGLCFRKKHYNGLNQTKPMITAGQGQTSHQQFIDDYGAETAGCHSDHKGDQKHQMNSEDHVDRKVNPL